MTVEILKLKKTLELFPLTNLETPKVVTTQRIEITVISLLFMEKRLAQVLFMG